MTFFSGTDTSTLQKEGFDRNNFVSLIVNNAGEYSAAVTRKVDYTEKHDIEITGKYPFFGTRRVMEIPTSHTTEEKVKTVIEYFDLVVEKSPVEYAQNEYEARFNEILKTKSKPEAKPAVNYNSNYPKNYQYPYGYSYLNDDDDYNPWEHGGYVYGSWYDSYRKSIKEEEKQEAKETPKEEVVEEPTLFDDAEVFDKKFVEEALNTTCYENQVRMLLLMCITGCPIIDHWVKYTELTDDLFKEIVTTYEQEELDPEVDIKPLVFDALNLQFSIMKPEMFFPQSVSAKESNYTMENYLVIKMMDLVGKFPTSDVTECIYQALKEFYSL